MSTDDLEGFDQRTRLEMSLSLLVALNNARLRKDYARAATYRVMLEKWDKACGYVHTPDPSRPLVEGQQLRSDGYQPRNGQWMSAARKRALKATGNKSASLDPYSRSWGVHPRMKTWWKPSKSRRCPYDENRPGV